LTPRKISCMFKLLFTELSSISGWCELNEKATYGFTRSAEDLLCPVVSDLVEVTFVSKSKNSAAGFSSSSRRSANVAAA
jgi:hypothetical protein